MASTGGYVVRHSGRNSLWPEGLLLGAMAVMLLTPKPLATALDFNTYSAQMAGFLVFGFVVASRQPTPLPILRRVGGGAWIELCGRIASVILCAGALEAAQGLVYRTGRWFDFMVNASAVTVGAAIAVARLGLREHRIGILASRQAVPSERQSGVTVERRRFFIVSPGRSGSTLLAAILADCGAEFGLPVPPRWDRQTGDMEHPRLTLAARNMARAGNPAAHERRFALRRWRWAMLRSRAKRQLDAALGRVDYVKVEGGHELVRSAFKLGYFPSIIISYRRFEDYTVSLGLRRASATIQSLEKNYCSTLRSGLWLLNTFGGCVIGYEQLVDPTEQAWAEPLSRVTGIPADRLIAARDARVEAPSGQVPAHDTERHAAAAFDAVDALRHRQVMPSPQALRSWRGRRLG
jgi:hypothetical protein